MALLLSTSTALAHSWYPQSCCSGEDCHPVKCEDIHELKNGDYQWDKYTFPKQVIKASQDSSCHVCVTHWDIPICMFIQLGE